MQMSSRCVERQPLLHGSYTFLSMILMAQQGTAERVNIPTMRGVGDR